MRIGSVEGLRGVAIALVVIFHLDRSMLPSGFIGVDIFLTISGYVIFRSILNRLRKGEEFQVLKFAYRRVRRLLPTLLVALILFLPLLYLSQSPLGGFQNSLITGLTSLIGASNGVIQFLSGGYFGDDAEANAFLHTWSLAVEMQFYLVFGLIVFVFFRRLKVQWPTVRSLRLIAYLLFLPSIFITFVTPLVDLPWSELGLYGYYSPLPRLWQFALGGIVAVWPKESRIKGLANHLQLVSLVAILILSRLSLDSLTSYSTFLSSGLASLLTAIFLLGTQRTAGMTKLITSRPFLFLGKISYSLYVFHWPLLVISRSLSAPVWVEQLAVLVAVLIAWLNYIGLDRQLTSEPSSASIGRNSASSILVLLLLTSGFSFAFLTIYLQDAEVVKLRHQVEERHLPAKHDWLCATGPLTIENFDRCTISTDENLGRPLYLIGDSQAGMHAEAFLRIAQETKSSFVMTTTTSCPFFLTSETSQRCKSFVEGTLDFMRSAAPGTIVMAFAQFEEEDRSKTDSFLEILRELRLNGHNTFLVEAVPHFPGFRPLACSREKVESYECFPIVNKTEATEQLIAIDRLFSKAEENSLARTLEVRSLVCFDGKCRTILDDLLLYRDSSHLSVSFNDVSWRHLIGQLNYSTDGVGLGRFPEHSK